MRLVDFATDDKTRQAETAAEKIAKGVSKTGMLLPDLEIRTAIEPLTPESAVNSIMADFDEDDVAADKRVGYDLNSAFEYHKTPVKRKKPKQPSAPISKLPTPKRKAVAATKPDSFLDKQGNEYEYLGAFDGDLSFLDEKYKGVTVTPGQHLYRRATGVQFDGEFAEYEYYVGDDPETSAIFGNLFKAIGKGIKGIAKGIGKGVVAAAKGVGKAGKFYFNKVWKPQMKMGLKLGGKIAPFVLPAGAGAGLGSIADRLSDAIPYNPNSSFTGNPVVEHNGEFYEYVGRHNGDLSFLDEIEPGVIVPPGAYLYRKATGLSFDGEPEFEYFMGGHPDVSNGFGSFFKKIGKAVGGAVKAVGGAVVSAGKGVVNAAKWTGKTVAKGVVGAGKGIGNAAKWTVSKAIPAVVGLLTGQAAADASNGVVQPYNPTGGFEGLMSGGSGGYDETDYDTGLNQQGYAAQQVADTGNIGDAPVTTGNNKTIIYIVAALAIVGLFVYLNKK